MNIRYVEQSLNKIGKPVFNVITTVIMLIILNSKRIIFSITGTVVFSFLFSRSTNYSFALKLLGFCVCNFKFWLPSKFGQFCFGSHLYGFTSLFYDMLMCV